MLHFTNSLHSSQFALKLNKPLRMADGAKTLGIMTLGIMRLGNDTRHNNA